MKRIALAVLVSMVLSAGLLYAQSTQLDLDAEQIDLSRVDLSSAEFFFQGPLELYVDNVQYGNKEYAAILHYDGKNTITLEAPEQVTRSNKPVQVNVSDASISLSQGGIMIEGLVLDGGIYSGTFSYAPQENEFTLVDAERKGTVDTVEGSTVEKLREENEKLSKTVQQKEERIVELNQQLKEVRGETAADLREISSRLNNTLVKNPEETTLQFGSWSMRDGHYNQTDGSKLYAKRVIPVEQSGSEQLYSFEGASSGKGWRGFGLHFLASDVDPASKYGLGESYLIWITRDSKFYHTGKTYVQLYRSETYYEMVQLASNAVEMDSNGMNQYHVYVNHDENTISVFAGGKKVFTYEDSEMISEGSHIALRSLDTAEFSNVEVNE